MPTATAVAAVTRVDAYTPYGGRLGWLRLVLGRRFAPQIELLKRVIIALRNAEAAHVVWACLWAAATLIALSQGISALYRALRRKRSGKVVKYGPDTAAPTPQALSVAETPLRMSATNVGSSPLDGMRPVSRRGRAPSSIATSMVGTPRLMDSFEGQPPSSVLSSSGIVEKRDASTSPGLTPQRRAVAGDPLVPVPIPAGNADVSPSPQSVKRLAAEEAALAETFERVLQRYASEEALSLSREASLAGVPSAAQAPEERQSDRNDGRAQRRCHFVDDE